MGGLIAAEPLIRGNVELRLDQAGFTESESSVGGAQPFGLHNASSTAVRVCLGVAGDCENRFAGPVRLRAPGVLIPPGWRVWVSLPREALDLRLTIVGSDPEVVM